MKYDEFKAHLKHAGVSIKELADLLLMNPTSITNYRRKKEVPRHLAVIAAMLAELTTQNSGVDAVKQRLR